MENILLKTKELGLLIRESDAYKAVTEAENAMNDDPAIDQLMAEFQAARTAFQSVMNEQGDASSAADELSRLQDEINAHPAMKRYQETHEAFQSLMREVNNVLQEAITGRPAHACSGHCEGCGGCS